jgi:hypothetical protein
LQIVLNTVNLSGDPDRIKGERIVWEKEIET